MVQRKVDYKPFAPHNDSNLVSQETWENASTVEMGFVEGKASAKMVNKALRQATSISASFAEMIAKYADVDVLDDGNTLKLAEDFKTAIFNIAQMTMQENVLDQKYAKRIMMDVYANYQNIVILLCKAAPVLANPVDSGKVYSSIAGKLSFFRGDATSYTRLEQLNIAVHTAYRSSIFSDCNKLAMSHEAKSWDFRFATCMYGGEKWLVLKNKASNAQNFLGDFNGVLRFNDPKEKESFLKAIPYYEVAHDSVASKVLNQEIYDSLTEVPAEDIQKMTDAVGGEYYTSANKPTPSDLGAMYKELPLPNFHVPLNDDLKILHGFGDYDTITINEHVIDLATKSVGFTRSSVATMLDNHNILRDYDVDEPRINKYGLLNENPSRNVVPKSEQWTFSNFGDVWTSSETDDRWIELTAKTRTGATEPAYKDIANNGDMVADTYYTFSIDVKRTADLNCRFAVYGGFYDGVSAASSLNITYSTDLSTISIPGIRVIDYGDWFRLIITRTFPAAQTNRIFRIYPNFSSDYTTSRKFIYRRCQVEPGTMSTSYIRTTNGPVDRAGDFCWCPRLNNDGYFGDFTFSAEIYLEDEYAPFDNDIERRRAIISSYPTNTEYVVAMLDYGVNLNRFSFAYGSASFNKNHVGVKLRARTRVAGRFDRPTYKNDSFVNGVIGTSPITVTRPTPGSVTNDKLLIGNGAGTGNGRRCLNGYIRDIKIWLQPLSDEEVKWIR